MTNEEMQARMMELENENLQYQMKLEELKQQNAYGYSPKAEKEPSALEQAARRVALGTVDYIMMKGAEYITKKLEKRTAKKKMKQAVSRVAQGTVDYAITKGAGYLSKTVMKKVAGKVV